MYLWLYTIVPCTVYILHKLIWTRTWIDSWLFQILHFHFKPNIWWIFHGLIQGWMPWIFISSPIHGSSDTFLLQAWYILEFPETDTSDGCPASSFQFLNISWILHQLSQWMDALYFYCMYNIWFNFHGLIQQMDSLHFHFMCNVWWFFHARTDTTVFAF